MSPEILIPLIGTICFAFGFVAGRGSALSPKQNKGLSANSPGHPIAQIGSTPSAEVLQQVERLLRQRRKIEALKAYRDGTGVGLKEAKDFVDHFEKQLRLF